MTKPLKILAFTRYTNLGASSRLRTFQYLTLLKDSNIQVTVSPLLGDSYLKNLYQNKPTNWRLVFKAYLMQLFKLFVCKKYDLLWIEKELFPNLPAWFEKALNNLKINYIVDYDDAIFHNYDLPNSSKNRLLPNKIAKVMQNAALVCCGNNYLADYAMRSGASRIEIIPTVIDINRYAVVETKPHSKLVIGWIGTPVTVKYLNLIAPALQMVAKELPIQLRVIGATFECDGLDVDCRPWTEETEVKEIQDFDIGIMPLIDSPWERGKCGYKLIQYMACAKPIIASPIGVNNEIVIHGVNGFCAEHTDDWVKAFHDMYLNVHNRSVMGAKGRKIVEEKYSLQITAPRLAQLFHEVASQTPIK